MKVTIITALFVLLVFPFALAAVDAPADFSRTAAITQANLPLSFEPADASGQYVARGGANLISVMPREAAIVVANGRNGATRTLQVAFENANPAAVIEALQPLATLTHYYVGPDPRNWRLGIRNFGKLQVKNLYPGVDVIYYGNYRLLEFDFVVAPGADPAAIALSFSGADQLWANYDGELVAQMGDRAVGFLKPVAYQRVAGERKPVDAEYVLAGNGKVQLRLGDYDKRLELVIDPVVSYATYLGGAQGDQAHGITVDSSGNAYVTGQTCSPIFPGSAASLERCNTYVSQLNPTGSAVVYTTIIGGNHSTSGSAITMDAAGSIYVVGTTYSDTGLPLATNTYYGGDSDAFFAVLDPNGALLRTAYLGGSGTDTGYGVAVDSATPPNVIGVGQSCGVGRGDFPAYGLPAGVPTPAGPFNAFEEKVELCVAFVTKLDNGLNVCSRAPVGPGGTAPRYVDSGVPPAGGVCYFSQFFGGQPPNVPWAGPWRANYRYVRGDVITDGTNAQKARSSGLSAATMPTFSSTVGGVVDDGGITWECQGTTSLLINASSMARAAAVDPLGDIFVAGGSDSGFIGCDTCGEYSYWKGAGAWVLKLSATGRWVYSTVLGTETTDSANAIVVDLQGRAYVVGTSTGKIFTPANASSFQTVNSGGQDAFIVRMATAGTAIEYAGYLGGKLNDQGYGVAVDANAAAYVTGSTQSTDFPVVSPLINPLSTPPNLPMSALKGSQDAFVSKITPSGSVVVFSTYLGGASADYGTAIATRQNAGGENDMYVAGVTGSSDFPTYPGPTAAPLQTAYGNNGDSFVAMILGASLPSVTINPMVLGFSPLNVNTSSTAETVTFTNSGATAIIISSISSTGDFSQTNNCPATSALAVGASCTVSVIFTPTAAGTRSGTLVFTYNGANSPQSVTLSGTGTALTGTGGSGGTAVGPDFSITAPSSALTVASNGGTVSFEITVAPVNGFDESVNLTCTAPSPATCAVAPTSVQLEGTAGKQATVTVTVPAPPPPNYAPKSAGKHGGPWQTVLPFAVFGLALAGSRKRFWLLLLVLLLCLALGLVGCGGGGDSAVASGMAPGTYNANVTGAYSGSGTTQSHTLRVSFTVQ